LRRALSLFGLVISLATPSGLWAQQTGYSQIDLVSNSGVVAVANTTDPQLLNPSGISFAPGHDFWIANNNSGTSTLYNAKSAVGYCGDETINAFDTIGRFLGQLTDSSTDVLLSPGLWDMVFGGGGSSGDSGTLYFTAGGNQPNFPAGGSTTSVFATLVPAASVGSPDFLLKLSSQSATIVQSGSANLTISAI
jgi:hypothetical protein